MVPVWVAEHAMITVCNGFVALFLSKMTRKCLERILTELWSHCSLLEWCDNDDYLFRNRWQIYFWRGRDFSTDALARTTMVKKQEQKHPVNYFLSSINEMFQNISDRFTGQFYCWQPNLYGSKWNRVEEPCYSQRLTRKFCMFDMQTQQRRLRNRKNCSRKNGIQT